MKQRLRDARERRAEAVVAYWVRCLLRHGPWPEVPAGDVRPRRRVRIRPGAGRPTAGSGRPGREREDVRVSGGPESRSRRGGGETRGVGGVTAGKHAASPESWAGAGGCTGETRSRDAPGRPAQPGTMAAGGRAPTDETESETDPVPRAAPSLAAERARRRA